MLFKMDVEKYIDLVERVHREKFDIFYEFLTECNKKFNLTAICEKKEVFEKHFLDSVLGEKFFIKGALVAEIGSGGGFPSLPLKIIREDLRFTLIESTLKKCEYLKGAVDKLGLDCVQVVNGRAEEKAREDMHREMYDICVARAVARLNTLCEYCLPFVKVGGRMVAYKGDCGGELEEAARAIEILGGAVETVERYALPEGDGRSLIVIKKVKHTSLKYPRGQGKERKCPIK